MKNLFFVFVCFIIVTAGQAQIKSAETGVVYGNVSEKGSPIKATELENNLKDNKFEGKITPLCFLRVLCAPKKIILKYSAEL